MSDETRGLHGEDDGMRRYCRSDLLFMERYEGWEELGYGGHGLVIRTLCRDTDMVVAVKLIPRVADEDHRRFKVEAQTLARIVHPSVVRTFAGFSRGPLAWIEMEYVEGGTLGHELRRRRDAGEPWLLAETLEIALSAAEGLAAVHAAGVVHRDVKPDNILLPASRRPPAKVVDFGIARLLEASSYTRAGMIPGTPRYGAPELVNGERVGPEADVYALAITLYLLFTGGTYPYALAEDASVGEIVYAHTRKAPIPLRSLAPGVPESVADCIRRGLDKTPKNRPSAKDVAGVMRAALEVVQGAPATSVPRKAAPRRLRGARVAVAVAAGVSMLILMSVIAAWRHWRGTASPVEIAAVASPSVALDNDPVEREPPTPLDAPQAQLASDAPSPAPAAEPTHEAGLRVAWAAPGVVGVSNESGADLVDVTIRVADATYPVGAVGAEEEAWVFAEGAGAITAEGLMRDGRRIAGSTP